MQVLTVANMHLSLQWLTNGFVITARCSAENAQKKDPVMDRVELNINDHVFSLLILCKKVIPLCIYILVLCESVQHSTVPEVPVYPLVPSAIFT